jgi:hypothetical protein
MLMSVAASAACYADGSPVRAAQLHRLSSLETSVQRLSTGLHLTAPQQERLRTLLVQQHDQVGHVWSDPQLSAGERIALTQRISHRTADAIRAMLDDEQRKLYNPPHVDKAPVPARSVDEWMQLAAGLPGSAHTAAGGAPQPGTL